MVDLKDPTWRPEDELPGRPEYAGLRTRSKSGPGQLTQALATYALFVQKETSQKKEWIESQAPDTKPIQLNLWCFDSSKAVHAILRDGARNVIFTSGIKTKIYVYFGKEISLT